MTRREKRVQVIASDVMSPMWMDAADGRGPFYCLRINNNMYNGTSRQDMETREDVKRITKNHFLQREKI